MIPDDYKFWCDYYLKKLDDLAEGNLGLPLPTGSINDPVSTTENQEKEFTPRKRDFQGNVLNKDEDGTLNVV